MTPQVRDEAPRAFAQSLPAMRGSPGFDEGRPSDLLAAGRGTEAEAPLPVGELVQQRCLSREPKASPKGSLSSDLFGKTLPSLLAGGLGGGRPEESTSRQASREPKDTEAMVAPAACEPPLPKAERQSDDRTDQAQSSPTRPSLIGFLASATASERAGNGGSFQMPTLLRRVGSAAAQGKGMAPSPPESKAIDMPTPASASRTLSGSTSASSMLPPEAPRRSRQSCTSPDKYSFEK